MKTAIVCEGGAMRGVYTAGVLQTFLDENFIADALVGVSAGASNGVSYVSGQKGRGYRTNVNYADDPRYLSFENYRRTRSFFGMDFLFSELADNLDPFDFEAFYASPCDFFAGALDVETGQTVYFGKQDIQRGMAPLRASCSMPIFSPMVEIAGRNYLDGGIGAPIPLDKALDDGYERIIVVLTQERGYRKKPQSFRLFYRTKYRKYPQLVQALAHRHLVYNNTLERLNKLEAEGRVWVVAPSCSLGVGRFGQDREVLIAAYHAGIRGGKALLGQL